MKLNMKRRTKKRVITRELKRLGIASEVNHVWALDFMRDAVYDGIPFRTLNVIDEGNREALCIECGMSIPSARLLRTMVQSVEVYATPQAIRLDNGPALTAQTFIEWAESKWIAVLHIPPGKPNQNAFVERFTISFRDGVLDANLFNTISKAQKAAGEWAADHNEFIPPPDCLRDMTSMEFWSRTFKPQISSFGLST